MSKQLLVHSNDIARARIVDTSYKNSSMDQVSESHDGRIVFSTKLKLSGKLKLVMMAHLAG